MIRCICEFSASSWFSRARSLESSPAYLSFQSRIVFGCTMTTTELGRRRSGLKLFEDPDDLRFAEAGLLHGESPWPHRPRSRSFDWAQFTLSGQPFARFPRDLRLDRSGRVDSRRQTDEFKVADLATRGPRARADRVHNSRVPVQCRTQMSLTQQTSAQEFKLQGGRLTNHHKC